jgi:large subunit ribosomal protein L9
MQVILLEKIVNLGGLGDVVKVRNGFARNFLIPQGKAKRATDAAIKEFETRRADLEKAQADKLAQAQALGEKLNGVVCRIAMKAGVDGRLFGSVTNFDISEALRKQGFEVAKGLIRMPQGPLKAVGEQPVTIALHSDVTADITVAVVGEQA